MRLYSALLIVFVFFEAEAAEVYRYPSAGDAGKYFILEREPLGNNIFQVLVSRVGKANAYTDFTRLKINCATQKYFELAGSSEDGAKDEPTKPLRDWSKRSKWVGLVRGSSKHDLVMHLCM